MPQSSEKTGINLLLSAEVDVKPVADGAKTAPISLIANGGGDVDYPEIGRIVFDFDTMSHKPKMQLDWEHGETNLGYLNHFNREDGALRVSGAIVPGHGKDEEFAKNLIAKMSGGVPYEASIETHGGRIDSVGEGKTVRVNGREFAGPISVIRDFKLAAVGLCKFGKDSNTAAELRLAASKTFKHGDDIMPVTTEQLGKIKLSFGTSVPADISADNAVDHLLTLQKKTADDLTAALAKIPADKNPPTAAELCFAGKALQGEINALILAGDITKAAADTLVKQLTGTEIGTLKLDRQVAAGDRSIYDGITLALRVFENLKGAKLGVTSGRTTVADDQLKNENPDIDGGEKDTLLLSMKAMNPAKK